MSLDRGCKTTHHSEIIIALKQVFLKKKLPNSKFLHVSLELVSVPQCSIGLAGSL